MCVSASWCTSLPDMDVEDMFYCGGGVMRAYSMMIVSGNVRSDNRKSLPSDFIRIGLKIE